MLAVGGVVGGWSKVTRASDSTTESDLFVGGVVDARAELLWASDHPRRWGGTLGWDEAAGLSEWASINSPVVLNAGPTLSGSVFETQQGGLVFGPPARLAMVPSGEGTLDSTLTQSGGVSFRVRGHVDDIAILKFEGDDIATGFMVKFRVADLVKGPGINVKVNEKASITIRRVAAGDLRVRLGNSSTIFWREQIVDVSLVNPMAVPTKPGSSLVLDCLTYSAADDRLVSKVSFPVVRDFEGLHCSQGKWTSPQENGAYRVRFRLRDLSVDRNWLSTTMSPTNMASSIGRSITTSLPQSLTTPLGLPLYPFNMLNSGQAAQSSDAKDGGGALAMALGNLPVVGADRTFANEPVAIAEATISIAVIASEGDLPATEPLLLGDDAVETVIASNDTNRWTLVGSGVAGLGESTASRLFIQPSTQWFNNNAHNPRNQKNAIHLGQRLHLIESGQQLEFSIPVLKAGARHRAVIRVPSEYSMRMIAELVDLDASTGLPQPLGPGLAIIRSGQQVVGQSQTSPSIQMESSAKQAASQVSRNEGVNDPAELWHEILIDFWPRSAVTRLVLSNRSVAASVAVGAVDVWVNESESLRYPSNKTNLRSSRDSRLTAMRLEISDLFEQFSDGGMPSPHHPLDYQKIWVATNRLIETLRREGYGGLMLTVSSDGSALFPDRSVVPSVAWNANWASDAGAVDCLRLMLRMFERESLQLIPCIRYSSPVLQLENKIRNDSTAGSIAAIGPLSGQLGAWSFDGPSLTAFPIYNSTSIDVLAHFAESIVALNERCRDRACVPAIGILADERSFLRPTSIFNLDDQTLEDFYASLGSAAPPREAVQSWIQNAGAERFARWHANRMLESFQSTVDQIDGRKLILMSLDSALPSSLIELARDNRIITTRLHRRSLSEPVALRVRDEACNASVPISSSGGMVPGAFLAAVFHQPVSDVRGFEPVAFVDKPGHLAVHTASVGTVASEKVVGSRVSGITPILDSVDSSLTFANLISRSDRLITIIGGGAMSQPGSDVRRRSLRTFAELPPVSMTDLESSDPLSSALKVRMTSESDQTYVYAVNQTRWPVVWEATFTRPVKVHRLGPIESSDSSSAQRAIAASVRPNTEGDSTMLWQTVVDGGELVAIRLSSKDARLKDWRSTFVGTSSQIATIRAGVDNAVARITDNQYLRRIELISNPSFESEGAGVPGWMLAQHPVDCVIVDSANAFHGDRSIRLAGSSGRSGGSWIVSETIAPPRSGRLAISARFRGGQPDPRSKGDGAAEPLVVRMALEGTICGTPIRKSKSLTFEANGKWSEPQWLEIAKLPSLPVESLRLTIDLMSAGEVWVDDIACYDQFMTGAEKTQWEHLVFLAAGGLSRGDFVGASRLFDSHWSPEWVSGAPLQRTHANSGQQVRRAHFNPSVSDQSVNSTGESKAPTVPKSPSRTNQGTSNSGFTDRLKSWIPRPFRYGS